MSYDPMDEWHEAGAEALQESIIEDYRDSDSFEEDIDRGIARFTAGRQKSYFVENPDLAIPAFDVLDEAKRLFALDRFAAAQAFAGGATEVAYDQLLIRPMLYGFVHDEDVAEAISGIPDEVKNVYKFKGFLEGVIAKFAGVTFQSLFPGSNKTLWKYIQDVKGIRNSILHGGNLNVSPVEAKESIDLASQVIETIFPALLRTLKLHLHGRTVCTDSKCKG